MPPLLCPSPVLLDQSFPRDEDQLNLVAVALGEVIGCVERNEAHLLLTETLREFVESFDWNPPRPFSLLTDIHRLLSLLYLQPNERLIMVDVASVGSYEPHPIPKGCENTGLIELWADELGKILTLHDQCYTESFFIGIACECAFSGEEANEYKNPDELRAFPLVGPDDLPNLEDAFEWTPTKSSFNDIRLMEVSFDAAQRNIDVLGAIRVENPRGGGSHYIVIFNGGRSWPLDKNTDPVPERFLKQLIPITGYPLLVIKHALIFGELPITQLRLMRVTSCIFGA